MAMERRVKDKLIGDYILDTGLEGHLEMKCKLVADTTSLCLALEELGELFKHVPNIPTDFIDRILRTLGTPNELITIKNQPAPMGTLVLSFEPSDFLLNTLVAVRAGDFDSLFLHVERHNNSQSLTQGRGRNDGKNAPFLGTAKPRKNILRNLSSQI